MVKPTSQIHPREARHPPPRLLGFGGSSCLAPGAASAHACVDVPNCLSAAGEFRNFARHRSNKRVITVCMCVMLSRPGNMQPAPFSLIFASNISAPSPPEHPVPPSTPSITIPLRLAASRRCCCCRCPSPNPAEPAMCVCVCAALPAWGGVEVYVVVVVVGWGGVGGVGDRGVRRCLSRLPSPLHPPAPLSPPRRLREEREKKHATLPILFSAHLHLPPNTLPTRLGIHSFPAFPLMRQDSSAPSRRAPLSPTENPPSPSPLPTHTPHLGKLLSPPASLKSAFFFSPPHFIHPLSPPLPTPLLLLLSIISSFLRGGCRETAFSRANICVFMNMPSLNTRRRCGRVPPMRC